MDREGHKEKVQYYFRGLSWPGYCTGRLYRDLWREVHLPLDRSFLKTYVITVDDIKVKYEDEKRVPITLVGTRYRITL